MSEFFDFTTPALLNAPDGRPWVQVLNAQPTTGVCDMTKEDWTNKIVQIPPNSEGRDFRKDVPDPRPFFLPIWNVILGENKVLANFALLRMTALTS